MKATKGSYGYIRAQKIKRTWITLALFAAPLLVFFYRAGSQRQQEYDFYSHCSPGMPACL